MADILDDTFILRALLKDAEGEKLKAMEETRLRAMMVIYFSSPPQCFFFLGQFAC
jgi:hypothetical protein